MLCFHLRSYVSGEVVTCMSHVNIKVLDSSVATVNQTGRSRTLSTQMYRKLHPFHSPMGGSRDKRVQSSKNGRTVPFIPPPKFTSARTCNKTEMEQGVQEYQQLIYQVDSRLLSSVACGEYAPSHLQLSYLSLQMQSFRLSST